MNKEKYFILFLISLCRFIGILILFVINPITAILINIVIDFADGPLYKYYFKFSRKMAQYFDKLWDYIYYIALMVLIINLNLQMWWILFILFIYRSVGEIIFFINGNKKIFIYFPNIFEYYTLGFLFIKKLQEITFINSYMIISIFIMITIFKIWNEIFLHKQNNTFFEIFWLPLFRFMGFGFAKRIKD